MHDGRGLYVYISADLRCNTDLSTFDIDVNDAL